MSSESRDALISYLQLSTSFTFNYGFGLLSTADNEGIIFAKSLFSTTLKKMAFPCELFFVLTF